MNWRKSTVFRIRLANLLSFLTNFVKNCMMYEVSVRSLLLSRTMVASTSLIML
jgi:hypothetical protein